MTLTVTTRAHDIERNLQQGPCLPLNQTCNNATCEEDCCSGCAALNTQLGRLECSVCQTEAPTPASTPVPRASPPKSNNVPGSNNNGNVKADTNETSGPIVGSIAEVVVFVVVMVVIAVAGILMVAWYRRNQDEDSLHEEHVLSPKSSVPRESSLVSEEIETPSILSPYKLSRPTKSSDKPSISSRK